MNSTSASQESALDTPALPDARSRSGRVRRALTRYVIAPAAVLAAATTIMTATGLTAASASTTHNWIATGWNVHLLNQADPLTAAPVFNTPGSFGTAPGPSTNPISDGFATTGVLSYTSYTQFASDIKTGAITFPYQWVMFDPEQWSQTPVSEQKNPAKYMRLFGQLAHSHGFKVIMSPARDLGTVTNSVCPVLTTGESLDHWYTRCNLAGAAAAYSDIYILQNQVNTTTLSEFDSLFTSSRTQALAANPKVAVDVEVSTNYGTPAQMAAAAQSVNASGYYLSVTTPTIPQADQFYKTMHTAGF